jgi:homoserine O-acetyltransferase
MIPVLLAVLVFMFSLAGVARAATWPQRAAGTWVIHSYRFADGERMTNVKLHYVTLGSPQRDRTGHVTNAVLVMHGTGGSTAQFLGDNFVSVPSWLN